MRIRNWSAAGAVACLIVACGGGSTGGAGADDGAEKLTTDDFARLRAYAQDTTLMPDIAAACPPSRTDDVCNALRAAESTTGEAAAAAYDEARTAVAARFAADSPGHVTTDPAVRLYLRERVHALTMFNTATKFGANPQPADFGAQVDSELATEYSLYDPASFKMAHAFVPPKLPATTCAKPTAALLVFVGVVRLQGGGEFKQQIALLNQMLPCLRVVKVDTGTFVSAHDNAAVAKTAIDALDAELGPLPLHFLGYSQGATNSLETLVEYPEIAARVRTELTLNSAAHGSEAVDFVGNIVSKYQGGPNSLCSEVWPIAQKACTAASSTSLRPYAGFLNALFKEAGLLVADVNEQTLGQFLADHAGGLTSLTTAQAAQFWANSGDKLPKDAAYFSFRSAITDETKELPVSNLFFYETIVKSTKDSLPFNDMQVRVENHVLGGPLQGQEVVGRIADGNHWMWELTSDDVHENVMPKAMFDLVHRNEMLLAYYETFAEVGLLAKG